MLEIPLQPQPSQTASVVLADQNVQITLYQKEQGLFVDVNSNGVDVVRCVIARNAVPIICRDYTGFSGNILFIDREKSEDPEYTGLGSRFALCYFSADEYALIRE